MGLFWKEPTSDIRTATDGHMRHESGRRPHNTNPPSGLGCDSGLSGIYVAKEGDAKMVFYITIMARVPDTYDEIQNVEKCIYE